MFDVAFSEILVIAVVALIVIGPEKLPKVARTLGLLTGRVQRYMASVKADIEREMHLEDMRKLEEETRHSILDTQSKVEAEARDAEQTIKSAAETAKPDTATKSDKPESPT